jgi:hypothetical protein
MDKARLMKLAGIDPKANVVSELRSAREQLNEAHTTLIRQLEDNAQLDEGLFDSLKAALTTAGQLTVVGAREAAKKAKALTEPIKQMYLDNKARGELTKLTQDIAKVIASFADVETKAPTVISRDKEVADEIKLFKSLLQRTLDTLTARLSVQNEGLLDPAIKNIMLEHGYIEEKPLLESKAMDELIAQVRETDEFKALVKKYPLVSTKRELGNGTLVFNTGVAGLDFQGEPLPKSAYLLKAYADGQIRAMMKNGGSLGRDVHYRLGKKIVSKDGTMLPIYRAMLKEILERADKKVANAEQERQAQVKRYIAYLKGEFGDGAYIENEWIA